MAEEKSKKFCDTPVAAKYLDQAESTLNKMRLSGDGPRFYKFGRSVRYTFADLDAWAEARSRRSTSEATKAA
jgi:hypothetical protein